MKKIALDLSPLTTGHAGRGIGTYTRLLQSSLISTPSNFEFSSMDKNNDSQADLFHYPYFDFFKPTLPLQKKKPTVVTIHDVIPLLFSKHYPRGIKGELSLLHQKLSLQSVSAVITDSQASKRDITKYLRIPEAKVEVIYLAPDPKLVYSEKTNFLKFFPSHFLDKKYILYVGDINYNKNIPQLIKALQFLPDNVVLVCVGKNFKPKPIPEWQAIEVQIAMSNVGNRVLFLTHLSTEQKSDLASLYSHAMVYVQPSLAEGFGLPVLEALQCGTPVVVAKNSSLVEIAGQQAIFVGTDAKEIADGVSQVMKWTKPHRKQIILDGVRWSKQFTWEEVAQKTIQVYKKVLGD